MNDKKYEWNLNQEKEMWKTLNKLFMVHYLKVITDEHNCNKSIQIQLF